MRGKTQRPALYTVLLIAASLVTACGDRQRPDGPVRIQVFTGAYSSIPVHVADEKGFFSKHGLAVEKLPANSSSAAIAAMLGGSMDIVESAADLVLSNVDKGINLKYLMANESSNYVTVVIGNHVDLDNDTDYPAVVANFRGQRIGVNAIGSTLHLTGLLMLEEAGLSPDDVEFVATGSAATTMSAWRAGSVDIQITFAPVPELLETLGVARRLFVLADEGPEALKFEGLYGGWVTTGEFVTSRHVDADGFIAAMREAIDWIRDPANSEEMLEITKRYAPVSALAEEQNNAVMAEMIRQYRRFWGYEISPAAIDMWNDYALRFDLIKDRVAFEELVYDSAPVCSGSCQ